jgi:ATP-binding cassette subfamily B protein RaxB
VRIARLQISLETVRSAINGSEVILVVYLGAGLVLESAFTVGMLYAFMAYRSHFSGAVGNLVDEFIRFRMLGLHLERVADIGHTRIEACFAEADIFGPPVRGSIELDNVSFRYSATGPLILESLSLQFAEHRLIALSGASGCGKSTLLKILLGLLEPSTGRLLVAGKPLTPAQLRGHRSAIGAVLQEDAPLAGSIIDNVSHFDPQPDLQQIQTCCTLAEIHRDIVAMPMGYHSVVGDMGAALSAGQRQRVLLARALYHNPCLVLLDEGTSHIDTVTAISIIQNLRTRDMTCVYVTHSEALLALADEVICLEPGGTLAQPASPGCRKAD